MSDAQDQLLHLRVVSPVGVALDITCDSIRLSTADGSLGIKRGHLPSLILLHQGQVNASLLGKSVGQVTISGGFATVSQNTVLVITSKTETDK